ncbi:hypothetical protein V6N12_010267 [Hibiscus sabdariffa]|uniref:Uncharacterized protein n=1 Tax=Hibiscus sabdariffa TaxID=183260 RepID=A0ABR1ZMW8_9ROSI
MWRMVPNNLDLPATVLPNKVGGGFVKEAAAYPVTDDLVVMPMSSISIITLLNRFNVKDVGDLQEKIVGVGIKEGLAVQGGAFCCFPYSGKMDSF